MRCSGNRRQLRIGVNFHTITTIFSYDERMKLPRSSILGVSLLLSACGGGAVAAESPPPNTGGSSQTAQAAGVFLIRNQSSQTICYAMISPNNDPNWGPDRLGTNTIPAGGSYMWQAGVGVWDVQLQ